MRNAAIQDKKTRVEQVKCLSRVALLSAVALVLSFIGTMIPLPLGFPGFKLGLANVAILVALYAADAKSAACVAAVKVAAAGFLFGGQILRQIGNDIALRLECDRREGNTAGRLRPDAGSVIHIIRRKTGFVDLFDGKIAR